MMPLGCVFCDLSEHKFGETHTHCDTICSLTISNL